MKIKCIVTALLVFIAPLLYAQQAVTVPAMFHGDAGHSGIFLSKDFKGIGEVKWKFKTGGKIFSSPVAIKGIAFIGSEDSNLYAIDVNTGKQKWKFKTGGAVHSSPAVYNNSVYFGSFDGCYYAVDINTGTQKWKFKTGGEKWMGGKAYWGMQPADMYIRLRSEA